MVNEKSKNIFLFFLSTIIIFLLSGCATKTASRHTYYSSDGPPSHHVNADAIPDAKPKVEPLSKYGNKSYTVFGKRYHVLPSAHGYSKRGIASWYGKKFHGRPTSSREPYSLYAMTAASRDLPLPTYVRVTNLQNGRQVVVKVNDRGPFSSTDPNRIMDLSYAAAKKLGYAEKGTAWVHVTALDPRTGRDWVKGHDYAMHRNKPNSPASRQTSIANNTATHTRENHFYLQIGAFSDREKAEKMQQKIASMTQAKVFVKNGYSAGMPVYKVQIGPFVDNAQKEYLQRLLENKGLGHAMMVAA